MESSNWTSSTGHNVHVDSTGLYIDGEFLEDSPEVMRAEVAQLEATTVVSAPQGETPADKD